MAGKRSGTLVIIGGAEDREGRKEILNEVADRVGRGKLVIITVGGGKKGDESLDEYEQIFRTLGVPHVYKLAIASREDARSGKAERAMDEASGVFFTGGDQLETMSRIGDSLISTRVHEIYAAGHVIAGTSSGASIMSETMLIGGNSDESSKIRGSLQMAPGLGLLKGIIIDQHFAERGRITRLLGAVAQNPAVLGIGIDEDTAMIVENHQRRFTVCGNGAVYVVDGKEVTYSNLSAEMQDETLSVYDVRLHVLSRGHQFEIKERRPEMVEAEV
jgi:cyanophycinase